MNNKKQRITDIIKKLRPLLILLVIIPCISFMYYPMAAMAPRDLHVGIVNLDKGATFEQGKVNIGDEIVNKLTNKSDANNGDESPVVWETYNSKKEAKKALQNNKIYAYLVIPNDYSKTQTSSLDGLNNLGDALVTASSGVGKVTDGVDQMSGKLGKLPSAFKNVATLTGGLAGASDNLNKVSGDMGTQAGAISNSVMDIASYNQETSDSVAKATEALNKLSDDMAKGASKEILNADIAAIQENLNSAESANSSATKTLPVIGRNSAMISGESAGVSQGLSQIKTANDSMSAQFGKMAEQMSGVESGTDKMGTALNAIGEGLDKMSKGIDENVTDAIDTINSDTSENGNEDEENSSLEFYMDQSCNAFVPTTLGAMINKVASQTGMKIETIYVNPLADGAGTVYLIMAFMMLCMMCSLGPSIVTGIMTRPKGNVTIRKRLNIMAWQIVIAALIALTVGTFVPRIVSWMCGLSSLDFSNLTPFIALFCFGLIILTLGVFDLLGMVGVAVPLVTIFCGLGVGMLPYEFLPDFYQKYIYPWEPLRHLTDGIRQIIYKGSSWWNDSAQVLIWITIIGLIIMLLSIAKSLHHSENIQETEQDAVF